MNEIYFEDEPKSNVTNGTLLHFLNISHVGENKAQFLFYTQKPLLFCNCFVPINILIIATSAK